MNILLIGTGIPTRDMNNIGGAGIAVIKIAETLAKREKVFVIPRWSERPKLFGKNQEVNGVEYIRRIITGRLTFLFLKHVALGSFRYPMKYSHGLIGIKYDILYLFDRAHAELALSDNKIDVVHIHGIPLHNLPYIDASIDRNIPIVYTSHGSYSLNSDVRVDFDRAFETDTLKRLSDLDKVMITTVSNGVKELFIHNFQIPHDKIEVVFNGVDGEFFGNAMESRNELKEKYGFSRDKVILLQVGTLSKLKNHISVLTAIREMDGKEKEKLLYLIVGDGDEKDNLKQFIKENDLGNYVHFTNFIPPSQKLVDMYHLSNFFILPSTSEGFPLVFLEALASGLPIITFGDLQGVSDIFNPVCMEIVPKRDVESLILAINRAKNREWDSHKIIEFGKSWNWDVVCEEYHKKYRCLMELRSA